MRSEWPRLVGMPNKSQNAQEMVQEDFAGGSTRLFVSLCQGEVSG